MLNTAVLLDILILMVEDRSYKLEYNTSAALWRALGRHISQWEGSTVRPVTYLEKYSRGYVKPVLTEYLLFARTWLAVGIQR